MPKWMMRVLLRWMRLPESLADSVGPLATTVRYSVALPDEDEMHYSSRRSARNVLRDAPEGSVMYRVMILEWDVVEDQK